MNHIYGGKLNCLGKDAARSFLYSQVKRKDFLTKDHLIVASRELGDYYFLRRYGVKTKHIIACDIDPIAVARARKAGIRSAHVRIEECVPWYLEQYGTSNLASINVDLCQTVNATAPVFDDVLCSLNQYDRSGSVRAFLTFFRARDCGGDRIDQLNRLLVNSQVHIEDHWTFQYQSYTLKSIGAPMTALYC